MSKPSSKGKRAKRTTSQRDSDSNEDPFFSKEQKAARFHQFEDRKLERHKTINLQWFAEQGFAFPNSLLLQHLEMFCNLNGNIYPKLIWEFYANLVNQKDEWTTEVKGTKISVSLEALAQAAGMLNFGESFSELASPDWEGANHFQTFLSCVRPGKRVDGKHLHVGLLNVHDRLLHYVIVYILVPRLFNRAQLKAEDLKILYALKNEIQVNWADVVRSHMIRRHKEPNSVLLYPTLISKLIVNAGVDVTNAAKLSLRERDDKIDSRTLKKMKIGKKDDIWCWLEDNHPDIEMGGSDDNIDTESGFPESSQARNPSLEHVLEQVQSLFQNHLAHITVILAEQDRKIEKINERIENMYKLLESLAARKDKTSSYHPHSSMS